MIVVIDYGMGNLRSVSKALEHVGAERRWSRATRRRSARRTASSFPGQGAMPDCMRRAAPSGPGRGGRARRRAKPFLGLCIGPQMLFDRSAEGDTPGLGISRVASSASDSPTRRAALEVPHMGWNHRRVQPRSRPLWRGIAERRALLLRHSYYCVPEDDEPSRRLDARTRRLYLCGGPG